MSASRPDTLRILVLVVVVVLVLDSALAWLVLAVVIGFRKVRGRLK